MSEIQLDTQNRALVSLDGKIFINPPAPALEFRTNQNQFPPKFGNNNGYLRFTSVGDNIIYIDFDDGTPIFSQAFSGNFNMQSYPTPFYNYTTAEERIVKIWFEFPQRIRQVNSTFSAYGGTFPTTIGLYNLDVIYFNRSYFNVIPTQMTGGSFEHVRLSYATQDTIHFIPEWIISSKIKELTLVEGFDLSNLAISNLDRLIEIQGLETLDISSSSIDNNAIPSNWKDITSLRTLGLGSNPITEITQELNDCKQLTTLSIGYRVKKWVSAGSSLFTSWGIGVSDMPNLTTLRWAYCTHISDVAPTGLETATNLKTLDGRNCYDTELRINNFIDSIYSLVTMYASMSTGNTLLRQVNLNVGYITFVELTTRPSGLYQAPSGYTQGVSNGTPESQMEKIYVLVNQYDWTITVKNQAGTNNQVYAP